MCVQFPGDSVITGRMKINGRTCFVFSQVSLPCLQVRRHSNCHDIIIGALTSTAKLDCLQSTNVNSV